jgi:hypothetical protein
MHQGEWAQIVARLNLNWPGQQITKLTADDWFPKFEGFPAAEVWEAIDRCRSDITPGPDGRPRGAWLPNLADILAAIDANWHEAAAARRELEATAARAARNGKGGATAPPEWTDIRRTLEASKALPESPGHMLPDLARQRIDALVDQLDEREAREQMGTLT